MLLVYTIGDMVSDGDMLITCPTASGTRQGGFLVLRPTGRAVTWQEAHFCRVEGDKLAGHWVILDQLAMLQQCGVIPAMGATA